MTCPEHHSLCATAGDFLAGLVFQSVIISLQGSCWSTVKVGEDQEIFRDEIPAAPTTLLWAEIVSNGLLATPPIVRGGDHAQPGFFCLN
jgi:hypothetical protein